MAEREALVCVWVCERWHIYLYGRHFTLRTDHQALKTLLNTSGSSHKPLRLNRWTERLKAYNFSTQFIPGKENMVADLLSRATPTSLTAATPELVLMLHLPLKPAFSLQELEAESAHDPTFTQLRTYIREGWPTKITE